MWLGYFKFNNYNSILHRYSKSEAHYLDDGLHGAKGLCFIATLSNLLLLEIGEQHEQHGEQAKAKA